MAGISFSVQQFIKLEQAEVRDVSTIETQESITQKKLKYFGFLNGEYAIDINSPEFDLKNIATESIIAYETGESLKVSKAEKVKQKILEKKGECENMNVIMNRPKMNTKKNENFDLLKINYLKEESVNYNLNETKIDSMKTELDICFKEEQIISEMSLSYSDIPISNSLNVSLAQENNEVNFTSPNIGTSKFECKACGYKCKYEAIFQDHMSSHQDVTFTCDICDFRFRNKWQYVSHTKKGHNKDKLLKCLKCNYSNTSKNQFNFHLTETGHKLFKCSECNLQFHNKLDRNRHLFEHKIEMYECSECKKMLKYMHIQKHSNMHAKQIECIFCGYKARSTNRMQCHMLTHTNEKPYKCDLCEKCFKQDKNLKRHMSTHQNRESRILYECGVCKKTYTLKQALKKHYKKSNHG
ncbi:unnamed protein product [Meganyctiphanes norvegica]|uniref:C2H2-type domain-containing protein n=1 Tax=Meganyctiphanes norvegica TaxID=48144 RepID=A0AAV2SCN5_MEGNR